jgi:hypothetical protein
MTNLPELAFSNYQLFKSKIGSAHIATFSSQLNLIELLEQNKCQSVLDYGSGIGTLTKLMEKIGITSIYSYEQSDWCREQAIANLYPIAPKYLNDLSEKVAFEAICVDDEISRRQIVQVLRQEKLKVIFIEGWRNKTAAQVSRRLLMYGYAASFTRGTTRQDSGWAFSKNLRTEEKAGCWFVIEKKAFHLAFLSWVRRVSKTSEFSELLKEFYFWVRRSLSIRKRLRKYRKEI